MQDHRITRHPVLSLGTVGILRFLATTTELRRASMFRARPFLARRRHEWLLLLVVASGFSKAVLLRVLGDARLQFVPAMQSLLKLRSPWRRTGVPLKIRLYKKALRLSRTPSTMREKSEAVFCSPQNNWKARSGSPSAKVLLIQTSLPPYNSRQL